MVLHINNEQPLLADLYTLPANSDVAVLCTNLRELNGKRPVFADHIESDFLFPLLHLRFIEMPVGTVQEPGDATSDGVDGSDRARSDGTPTARSDRPAADDRAETHQPARLPAGAPVGASGAKSTSEPESDLDIDEDFLRRVRDV